MIRYGTSQASAYRQAGEYVGVVRSQANSHFELVINRATAKPLNLQIPRLTALAGEVIE